MSGTKSTSQRFPGEVGSAKMSCAMPISRTRLLRLFGALRLLGGGQLGEGGEEGLPVRADLPVRIHQFVIAAVAQAGIAGEQSPVELEGEPRFQVHGLTFMGRCPANCASLAGPAVRWSARG